MKKKIVILLIAVMAVSIVACGDKKDNQGNANIPSVSQSEVQTPEVTDNNTSSETNVEPEVITPDVPEGYDTYVNQGATIIFPTDTYQKSMMGGIEKIEGETPWIKVSILGDSFDKQKELCEEQNGNSSDYSLEEITVGEHKALKCIYSDSSTYFMEVIIDTTFINDPFWAGVAIKVNVPKSKSDMSVFEDETLWDIINSFYFDAAKKYSF